MEGESKLRERENEKYKLLSSASLSFPGRWS